MTLKTNFAGLTQKLETLESALDHLLFAVVEAQPEKEKDHPLIVRYDEQIEESIGLVKGAAHEAARALQAVARQPDWSGARLSLIESQRQFLDASEQFCSKLMFSKNREDLEDLVEEDPPTWESWVNGLTDALEYCLWPFQETNRAFFNCWESLSEHDGQAAISVRNVNTGQQLNLGDEQLKWIKANP